MKNEVCSQVKSEFFCLGVLWIHLTSNWLNSRPLHYSYSSMDSLRRAQTWYWFPTSPRVISTRSWYSQLAFTFPDTPLHFQTLLSTANNLGARAWKAVTIRRRHEEMKREKRKWRRGNRRLVYAKLINKYFGLVTTIPASTQHSSTTTSMKPLGKSRRFLH